MVKSMALLGAGGVALVLLITANWVCWSEMDTHRGLNQLQGRLNRVEVQFGSWGLVVPPRTSPWQGKWVGTDDPALLAKVETWLLTLKRPVCDNALRQRGGRIILTFADGRQEELLFRGPDRPGSSGEPVYGFIWDGREVIGGYEPFTDFLRELPVEE
jgi:hypothetical protein